MAKLSTFLSLLTVAFVYAKPAKDPFDQATAVDIDLNSVNPDKVTIVNKQEANPPVSEGTNANVYLTDVSFGSPAANPKPGHAVARIIDDIFQIPIGVLQSVARLLRNPFISQKTPETASSY